MSKLPNKVYTYYHNINHQDDIQQELIEVWKKSWTHHGFEPVVLGEADATKHPDYAMFVQKIKEIALAISGKELTPYGLHCWLRWLAYSGLVDKGPFIVCDYDVINRGVSKSVFHHEGLTFFSGVCPCIALGTSAQFGSLAKSFLEISHARLELLRKYFPKTTAPHFHDQEFFQLNFSRTGNPEGFESLRRQENILFLNDRAVMSNFSILQTVARHPPLVHVAHSPFGKVGIRTKTNQMRLLVAKILFESST